MAMTCVESRSALPVEFGNAEGVNTGETGWFIGFSEWTKSAPHSLRNIPTGAQTAGLCLKWFTHAAGDPSGQQKPINTGRTVSILLSRESEYQLDCSSNLDFEPDLSITHTLRRAGDFVIWGADVYHRAFGIQPATILTLRWEDATSAA
jgi:hypothetical protein